MGRPRHEHRTAAALFVLLVLVYLWPALLGGQMLSPIAVLYAFPPWQSVAPAGIGHLINPALTDVPLSYYPWQVLARQLIHAGTFPAWNPYAFGGTPFFANLELAWLSPFSLPLWILPLQHGLGVAAALKLWVAGFGTYLLVRELKLGFWPALLAGVSFTLCAFNVIWLSHGVQVSVAVLMPWTIWIVERVVRRGRSVDGLLLAGIVALVLAGGHPGTQLHLLSGAVLYTLVRTGVSGDVAVADRLRRLGLIGAALLLGAALMAVVLVPGEEAARGTVGAAARSNGAGFFGDTMSIGALRTALFPDWWGRPVSTALIGPATYNERTFYAGALPLLLAVLALITPGGWRRKAPFALLGAIGAAVPVHLLGLYALVSNLPGFDRIQNQRILLWLLLAVAVLAAFGLQTVLDAPRRQRRAWGVVAGALLAGVVAAASLHVGSGTLGRAAHFFVHRTGVPVDAAPALASVAWWLVFVAGFVVVLLLARLRPERRWLVGGAAALVVALDLLHFAHGYQPIGPASTLIAPRTPAIAYLQRHTAGGGRIASIADILPKDATTAYHLHDARGYDAPQPSFRYDRLWRVIDPELPLGGSYKVPGLDSTSVRILGLLGVRYVAAAPGTTVPARVAATVYRGRDATIFADALAMPRAIVAARVTVAESEDEELAAVADPHADPRRDAVVRRDEVGVGTAPAGVGGGAVRVLADENARVTLRATLPRAGLVVLGDAWAPGWSVTVDGRPARALQADVVLRGVVVGAGSHRIVWSYAVPGLPVGAAISLAGLLAALAWAGWLLARARRGAPPEGLAPGRAPADGARSPKRR